MDVARLLVAIIVGVAGLASVGLAGDVQEVADTPPSWTVPAPWPGDRGNYYLIHVRDGPAGTQQVGHVLPVLRFGAEQGVGHDASGAPHATLTLRVDVAGLGNHQVKSHDWEFRHGDLSVLSLDQRRLLQFGSQHLAAADFEATLPGFIGEENANGQTFFLLDAPKTYYGGAHCPIVHRLQGMSFDPAHVEPFMECAFAAGRVDPERSKGIAHDDWLAMRDDTPQFYGDPFRARGVVDIDGVPTLVLDQDGDAAEWGGRLRVWLQEGNPYVVRAEETRPGPEGLRRIWVLEGFERGVAPTPGGRPSPAPPLELANGHAWGPDDTGWPAWAPSAAFASLAASPQHDWLKARPTAFLMEAAWSRTEDAEEGLRKETWAFSFRAGDEAQRFDVVRTQRAPGEALPWSLGDVVPSVGEDIEVMARDEVGFHPWPDAPAEQWPRLSSVLARDAAMGGGDVRAVSLNVQQGVQVSSGGLIDEVSLEGGVTERKGWDVHDAFWSWNGTREALITSLSMQTRSTLPPSGVQEAAVPVTTPEWRLPPMRWVAATGSGALFAALAVYFWPHIKVGVIALFSRIRHDEVLEHPLRRHIFDLVESQPGIHTQAIVRAIGGGYGNTQHHIDKLVAAGKVVARHADGYTCHFPPGTDRRLVTAGPALASGTARAVLQAAMANPGVTAGRLASIVGMNRGTLSHHAQRLVDAGLLERRRQGRNLSYWATPLAAQSRAAR